MARKSLEKTIKGDLSFHDFQRFRAARIDLSFLYYLYSYVAYSRLFSCVIPSSSPVLHSFGGVGAGIDLR
jgi:hypothetical protein